MANGMITSRHCPRPKARSGTPYAQDRHAMEPRWSHRFPTANGETDRRKLKLVPFVCQTDARNESFRRQPGFACSPNLETPSGVAERWYWHRANTIPDTSAGKVAALVLAHGGVTSGRCCPKSFPGKFGTSGPKRGKCRVFQGFVVFSPILAPESRTREKLQEIGDRGCQDTPATAAVTADHIASVPNCHGAPSDGTAKCVPKEWRFHGVLDLARSQARANSNDRTISKIR
jgi:hypothetical protein